MVKAIKHFHVYLYGRKFLLRTDHSALQWLLSFRHPEGQIARWLERLQQYDFVVKHRAGTKHGNADALSRRPCLLEICKHCDRLDSLRTPQMTTKAELPESQSRSDQISHNSLPLVATLSLSTGTGSPDIKPVLIWKESQEEKPDWEEIAPYSHNMDIVTMDMRPPV